MGKHYHCEFIAGADREASLPPISLPEIAVAGRSNVGKSTLINTALGRKALARTSQTPGRTQQLNFFRINDAFHLVDLPGYGYAKTSKTRVAAWTELTQDYLRGRPSLRRVLLLLDARREKPSADDLAWMDMLDEAAVPYVLILTKADKVSAAELESRISAMTALAKDHPAALPEPVVTSSISQTGIRQIRGLFAL